MSETKRRILLVSVVAARRLISSVEASVRYRETRLCFAIAEQRVKGREKPSLPHAHLIGHEQPDENYHA
jgi:hypothetical protein